MSNYCIYTQINDEREKRDSMVYNTFSEAESALFGMIAKHGGKMNASAYICAIRNGKYKSYRKSVADALDGIFSDSLSLSVERIKRMADAIEDFKDDCLDGKKVYPDDFFADCDERTVIIDFLFDRELHLEFDIESDQPDGTVLYSYFYMQDRSCSFKARIEEIVLSTAKGKTSNSANILYVYKRLLRDAKEAKDAMKTISVEQVRRGITVKRIKDDPYGTGALSEETIVKYIKTLNKLGIPIKHYKVSREEKEFWEARHICCNEGYEIDIDFLDKVPDPVDASGLGDKVSPLLVLFVMKTAEKPMRQADIIKALREKYNVEIGRVAVGRHINFLIDVAIEKLIFLW